MLSRRIIYLVVLAGCLTFYLAYQQWLAAFLLAVVVILPWFSLIISLPAMLTARVQIKLPTWVTQGTSQELTLYYGSRLPTPPWKARVLVKRPLTGEQWVLKGVDTLPTQDCGMLECSFKKTRIYDYLGLFSKKMKHGEPQKLIVRPLPVATKIIGLERVTTRAWRPKRGGGFAENHELRLYRPGDNIQQIHWKLSAKTGSLILREPMEPIRNQLLLQLDLQGTPRELNRKLGRLLWLGQQLLDRDLHFRVDALTGEGILSQAVTDAEELSIAIDALLSATPALSGSLRERAQTVHWQTYIGGQADEG